MAIIGRIRKRAGIIVALVAVALFSFVLSDFLFKGQSFFHSEQTAGEIAGNSISLIEFDNEVQRIAEEQKARMRRAALDDETMNQIRENVWDDFVYKYALQPQFHKAGIAVSEAEQKDMILGNDPDPLVVNYFSMQNGQLDRRFVDPMTGKLNPRAIKQMDDTLKAHQNEEGYNAAWISWLNFQERIPQLREQDKYLTLIKKGLYVTTAQTKNDYDNMNRTVSFKYISKPYASIPDSTVKVTEQDMLKYYNANLSKYKQEASRKLEYVIFDLKPTQQDFDEVKSQLEKVAEELKKVKSKKDDSLIVVRESDKRMFDTTHFGKEKLPMQIDSLAHASAPGTILPIYMENSTYYLAKVIDHETTPDSVKARQILIRVNPKDSVAKAKTKAKLDSIKSVIEKKHNFEEMAKKFSEDAGTKDTGGVLGWFGIGKLAPEAQSVCFRGKKGEIISVLAIDGYHLIEIQDQSPKTIKTEVGIIDRKVEPGTKTRQDVFNAVNDFIDKYHTPETFGKGVEEAHLVKRLADPLRESDKVIPGLENPREVIRWAFNAKKGEVSTTPFNMGDKYVVALLSEIREEGTAPMEQKKDEVEFGARKMKKGEMITEEWNKLGATSLEQYSSKLNLNINSAEGASFSSYTIPNVGREMKLYGPLFTLKQNETSKPVAGESGVYVIRIDKINEPVPTTDYSMVKRQSQNNYDYRANMEPVEAIKKKSEIKDNRAKFF